MKVRIIKKPEFTQLHHVQIKTWWWPFWRDVAYEDLRRCEKIIENIVTHGKPHDLIKEVKVK
jgi:hypothetical protein